MKHEEDIKTLVAAFRPKDWSESSLRVYCLALEDLDETYVTNRIIELLKTAQFMPSVADIRSVPSTTWTPDEIMSKAKRLFNHPSERTNQDTLTLTTLSVIEKLGGWDAFRMAPDPQYAPASLVNAYKNQIKDALYTVKIEPPVERKAIEEAN